ncbi:hypothetical protein LXL04_010031 [Taraxacum kok-saghyz]
MIPKYFPITTFPLHKTSITPLITFHNKIPHTNSIYHDQLNPSKSSQLSIYGFKYKRYCPSKQTPLLPIFASKGSKDGDNNAMGTVLRLYEAIKNKNLNEMSEIIGHDCLCVCSFVSAFQTFRGKKQVMDFFSFLMSNLGNKFEFVVQPTMHDGMTVGVSWKLECCKTHKPLGKGFSLHMCHIYQGKVLIRNVEMFLEPLSYIDPPTLKMVVFTASIMGQMASKAILKGDKKNAGYFICSLLSLAIVFIVLRLYRRFKQHRSTDLNTSNVMAEGASSTEMDVEDVRQCMIVDLQNNGMFAPKPFAYLNDEVITIRGVDFGSLSIREFRNVLANICKRSCEDVYYCGKKQTLAEGIRRIDNAADYSEFHVTGYDNPPDYTVDLYIDHHREPVLDWAESDAPADEDSDLEWAEDDDDDDKDSQKSYEAPLEHEVDEEVPTFYKTTGDVFLSKLCAKVPDYANNDDEENYEPDQPIVYPVHDENQEWYKMKPKLDMKFSNRVELKNCVTNYS